MKNLIAWILALTLMLTGCAAIAEDAGVSYTVQIESGLLNIRTKPNLHAEVAGTLYPGDTVKATGYNGGWTQIDAPVEAGTGWVKSEYLTTTTDGYGQYSNTSGGPVRIRNGIGGDKIGELKAGKKANVTAWAVDPDGACWAFIGKGYVMAQYLSKVE
ncbi:MAG: SH3 domain-containing protein [Candidatus Limiplasma sp.]|nr:SH3 domain-containing protein [Candidatus Limiplasma sp.]